MAYRNGMVAWVKDQIDHVNDSEALPKISTTYHPVGEIDWSFDSRNHIARKYFLKIPANMSLFLLSVIDPRPLDLEEHLEVWHKERTALRGHLRLQRVAPEDCRMASYLDHLAVFPRVKNCMLGIHRGNIPIPKEGCLKRSGPQSNDLDPTPFSKPKVHFEPDPQTTDSSVSRRSEDLQKPVDRPGILKTSKDKKKGGSLLSFFSKDKSKEKMKTSKLESRLLFGSWREGEMADLEERCSLPILGEERPSLDSDPPFESSALSDCQDEVGNIASRQGHSEEFCPDEFLKDGRGPFRPDDYARVPLSNGDHLIQDLSERRKREEYLYYSSNERC